MPTTFSWETSETWLYVFVWIAASACAGQIMRSEGKNLLVVPNIKSANGRRSFSFAAPMIWNSLPEHIRNSCSLTIFRKQLKTHLFPLKITCTANDWFTGFLFGLILIIVGRSIELRLVVLVRCCVLTITSLMLLLWSETDGNVLLCYVMLIVWFMMRWIPHLLAYLPTTWNYTVHTSYNMKILPWLTL